jgi:hypothetical protein
MAFRRRPVITAAPTEKKVVTTAPAISSATSSRRSWAVLTNIRLATSQTFPRAMTVPTSVAASTRIASGGRNIASSAVSTIHPSAIPTRLAPAI